LTESFFNHYLDFFKGSLEITLGALTTLGCIILFFIVKNGWFLTGFSIASITTLFFTLNYFVKFQNFKDNLYLYLPKFNVNSVNSLNNENIINFTEKVDKIVNLDEDSPLKACRLYVQGGTYADIERKLGLSHPEQAHRMLQKGIRQLLEAFETKAHDGNPE